MGRFLFIINMPFSGIAAGSALEGKIDNCVERVMATGRDKSSAIAICRASLTRTKDRAQAVDEANYRDAGPASTQICQTCQFADGQQCTLFNFQFEPEWVCDRWRPDIEAARQRQVELQATEKQDEGKPMQQQKATRLGNLINAAIDRMVSDERSRADIVQQIAQAAGITPGTVNQIIDGSIETPPPERLAGIARVTGLSLSTLRAAAGPSEKSSFSVYKDAKGRWRWAMVSSSAYQDRDREIVSQKSLAEAVAEHDRTGQRGELDWWHTNILLGDADFGMLHGRMLLESGTFRDERIGAAISQKAAAQGGSLAFKHPKTEPENGVFHNIKIFRRSLLPQGRASNLFTSFSTTYKENGTMNEEKLKALTDLIGDEALVKSLLDQAEKTDKAAEAAGFTYKSHDDLAKMPADALLEYALTLKEYEQAEEEKASQQQPESETLKAIDERLDRILGILEQHGTAIKALEEKQPEPAAAPEQEQAAKEQTTRLAEVDERLKALESEQPRATSGGHRASQSGPIDSEDKGQIEPTEAQKEKETLEANPQVGPFADVAIKMAGGAPAHPYWGQAPLGGAPPNGPAE